MAAVAINYDNMTQRQLDVESRKLKDEEQKLFDKKNALADASKNKARQMDYLAKKSKSDTLVCELDDVKTNTKLLLIEEEKCQEELKAARLALTAVRKKRKESQTREQQLEHKQQEICYYDKMENIIPGFIEPYARGRIRIDNGDVYQWKNGVGRGNRGSWSRVGFGEWQDNGNKFKFKFYTSEHLKYLETIETNERYKRQIKKEKNLKEWTHKSYKGARTLFKKKDDDPDCDKDYEPIYYWSDTKKKFYRFGTLLRGVLKKW